MKFFALYMDTATSKPFEKMHCVPTKFSIFAGIFQGFWALYHRMWAIGALLIAIEVAMAVARSQHLLNEITLIVVNLMLFVYVGFSAADWREMYLKNRGYQLMEVVLARHEMEAQQRYFEHYLQRPAAQPRSNHSSDVTLSPSSSSISAEVAQ